jgi:hypothetical protein
MPDDLIARVVRVEQQVSSLQEDVRAMEPLVAASAEMKADMRHIDSGVASMRREIAGMRALMEQRDKDAQEERRLRDQQVSAERRATRTALWTLIGVLGAATITAIGAIVAAGIGG